MAKKDGVSASFLAKVTSEMPDSEAGAEAQLDYLLPLYSGIQSGVTTGEAKLAFLKPIIVDALQEIARRGNADAKYVTDTRRTMGMLVYSPMSLGTDKEARAKAVRIRHLVARHLGRSYAEIKHFVEVRRTTSYQVKWQLVVEGGTELIAAVRRITGMKLVPALTVGRVTKSAKLDKKRKGR